MHVEGILKCNSQWIIILKIFHMVDANKCNLQFRLIYALDVLAKQTQFDLGLFS